MNALVRKEVRLLLPSLSLGLGIVLAPVVLNEFASPGFNALLLAAGVIIALGIALAAFGREFGHGTFSGLLALPVSRVRLWWTKVLAGKGWSAPMWPVEYGGTGWSIVRQHLFEEVEDAYRQRRTEINRRPQVLLDRIVVPEKRRRRDRLPQQFVEIAGEQVVDDDVGIRVGVKGG